MRKKGFFTLFMTVFCVVAFAGMAFAAQNIFLKTTVPNIPKSPCYQAGTESLSLDNGTVLTNGDVFRYTLSNNVTVCKNINFYLRVHDGLAIADAALPASTPAEPVTSTDPAVDALNLGGGLQGTGLDFGLLVTGNAGSQVVNVQLVSRNKATGAISSTTAFTLTFVAGVPANQLIIKLFDEKFLSPYFWKISTGTAYLNDSNFVPVAPATAFNATDNTLCINTSSDLWLGEYVQFTANSLPAPTGVPVAFSGDFFIAHMFASATYAIEFCKGAIVGHIKMGSFAAEQGADSCPGFDFEPPVNYCTDHNSLNRVIIHSIDAPFVASGDYTLKLEIQVDRKDGNGFLSGDRGVYFQAGSEPQSAMGSDKAGACAAVLGPIGASTRFLANGTTTSPGAPADSVCTIAAANRAVILTTAASSMNINGTDSYLKIDLPVLKYDLSTIKAGDEVRIKITLTRGACIQIGPLTVNIGTFGCGAVAQSGSLLFPYFTYLNSGSGPTDWWDGIVIINRGTTAGTATLKATQKDNTVATATVTVPAKSLYVNLLENITWTGTVNGNACYIEVTTDYSNPDGFGMIAKEVTGESMGYLPRLPYLPN